VVEFKGIPFSPVGAFNPHFWVDKGERSTSKKYTLWEQSDVYIVEWPGETRTFDTLIKCHSIIRFFELFNYYSRKYHQVG